MIVRFWGTRGSIPVPGKNTTTYGGNTTCLELTLESGKTIILDAGTGIRGLGDKLMAEAENLDLFLLITHIHWDHVMGFPFFMPIYDPRNKITIDGYPTCVRGLRLPFDNNMGDGFFPVRFDNLKAKISYAGRIQHGSVTIDGVKIDRYPLQHPQGGFGYRFTEGKKTLTFVTDNELTSESWADRHPESYEAFCRDTDVLIHDAQYTPEERKERRGWGHSDYVATMNMAMRANAKKIILFHHDPSRKDKEMESIKEHCEDMARERKADIIIEAAREDSEFEL